MRTNAIWLPIAVSLAIFAGCGTPDQKCTGPNCFDATSDNVTPADGHEEGTFEDIDTVIPDAEVDVPLVDGDVSCDECTKDQIKCDGETKYRSCEEVDGCWKWTSKQLCATATPKCVCAGAEQEICIPEDGEPCVCIPDCEGKECGQDGCGGVCGTGPSQGCPNGQFCINWECGGCTDSECAPDETICNGTQVVNCIDVNEGTGTACYLFAQTESCPALQTCTNDKCTCEFKDCEGTCCEDDPAFVCWQSSCCMPNCAEELNECGSDGCGGSCGTCPIGKPVCKDGTCLTIEECPDNECNLGEQLCEGTVGYLKCEEIAPNCNQWSGLAFACPDGQVCDLATNQCKCSPNCTGKNCGPDGCDGECGTCTSPQTCGAAGKCVCDCTGLPVHPVCDLENNKTYNNSCSALCAGVTDIIQGACPLCEDLCTADEKEPFMFCGFDHVTYDSFCQLKCQIGTSLCTAMMTCPQVLYPGECQPDVCTGCPVTVDPICGTDGETYFNKCDLELCSPSGTGIHCVGDCVNLDSCPQCTGECAPVCGLVTSPSGNEIRKTFSNQCGMQCAGATLAEQGPCCNTCSTAELWVCTKAFKAFKNECVAACKAPEQLPTLYTIPTGPDGLPQTAVCEECKCDLSEASYLPVCGNDFNSYFNACAIDCAGTSVRCQGECSFDTCACPKAAGGLAIESEIATPPDSSDTLQRGVCGADGKTYGNNCSAAYFGTYVVQQTWCPTCATECQGLAYDPVCCQDGVTYANLCIPQKCNSFLTPSLCQKGRCCSTNLECDDGNAVTVDTCNTIAGVCESF